MKNLFLIALISTLLISACSSNVDSGDVSESDSESTRYITYKTAEFIIDVPEDWEIINSFDSSYPDGIRVAFKNNIKEGDFVANLSIIREENPDFLTSFDVMQNKLGEHQDHLLSYELLVQEELTLNLGGGESKTTLYTFSGKNSTSSETLEFMQTALSKTSRSYLITATYQPNEDEFTIERLETMMKSFELR